MQGLVSRSLLAAAPYTVGTTGWVNPPYPELTYPQIQNLAEAAYSNTTNAAGLAVQQLLSVSKQGVGGNGLCETGEMPSLVGNFTGTQAIPHQAFSVNLTLRCDRHKQNILT